MICKCPNCDGALEYNPSYAEMECPFCGNTFETQVSMQAVSRAQTQAEEPQIIHKRLCIFSNLVYYVYCRISLFGNYGNYVAYSATEFSGCFYR